MGGFCYLSFLSSNTTRSPSGRLAARNLERNARKYPAAYPGMERGGAQTRDKIMRKTEIISKSLMLSPRAEAEGFSSRTARSAPQMKTPPHKCGGACVSTKWRLPLLLHDVRDDCGCGPHSPLHLVSTGRATTASFRAPLDVKRGVSYNAGRKAGRPRRFYRLMGT